MNKFWLSHKILGLVCLTVFLFYGCAVNDPCLSNQHAVQAGFYSAHYKTDRDSALSKVSVYGLNRTDSLYSSDSLQNLFLPLMFDGNVTTFVVKVKEVRDTIWLLHTKDFDFVSRDCGYVFQFKLDTVIHTQHTIDSIAVGYPKVKYGEDAENIKIYFN